MHLAGMDLNLLRVFDAVMRERSATRAGEAIGLSQPAVSRALTRLRHHLKDDLFIRAPNGLRPTPRAEELALPVRRALSILELALDPVEFDAATSTRTFTLVTNDYVAGVLLPDFVSHITTAAPNVNLRLLPSTGNSLDLLDQQMADFSITPRGALPERFDRLELSDAEFVLVMRRGHELSEGEITLTRFAAAPHLVLTLRGDDRSFVDDVLDMHGLKRRVAMTINQASIGPTLVAASDMILMAPRELAEKLAPLHDLVVREAPIQGPPISARVSLIWHKRLASHPAHDWFRKTLVETVGRQLKDDT